MGEDFVFSRIFCTDFAWDILGRFGLGWGGK